MVIKLSYEIDENGNKFFYEHGLLKAGTFWTTLDLDNYNEEFLKGW